MQLKIFNLTFFLCSFLILSIEFNISHPVLDVFLQSLISQLRINLENLNFFLQLIDILKNRGIIFSIKSLNLTIVKSTTGYLEDLYSVPDPKNCIINSIKCLSRSCCEIWKRNFTWCPVLCVLDLKISTKKHPSPHTNPATH